MVGSRCRQGCTHTPGFRTSLVPVVREHADWMDGMSRWGTAATRALPTSLVHPVLR